MAGKVLLFWDRWEDAFEEKTYTDLKEVRELETQGFEQRIFQHRKQKK